VRERIWVGVEPVDPETSEVPACSERRAEIDAQDAFLATEIQDLVVQLGKLVGAGGQAGAQMWEERDGQRRVMRAALSDEGVQSAGCDRPARAGRLREQPVHVGGVGLAEVQVLHYE